MSVDLMKVTVSFSLQFIFLLTYYEIEEMTFYHISAIQFIGGMNTFIGNFQQIFIFSANGFPKLMIASHFQIFNPYLCITNRRNVQNYINVGHILLY